MVPHEPDLWVRAHVEKRWNYEGRWRLGCYYFVGILQQYRIYDADQCRTVGSATEVRDDQQRDALAGHEPPHGERDPSEPIKLREPRHVGSPR
jgi:hypothetical protein